MSPLLYVSPMLTRHPDDQLLQLSLSRCLATEEDLHANDVDTLTFELQNDTWTPTANLAAIKAHAHAAGEQARWRSLIPHARGRHLLFDLRPLGVYLPHDTIEAFYLAGLTWHLDGVSALASQHNMSELQNMFAGTGIRPPGIYLRPTVFLGFSGILKAA